MCGLRSGFSEEECWDGGQVTETSRMRPRQGSAGKGSLNAKSWVGLSLTLSYGCAGGAVGPGVQGDHSLPRPQGAPCARRHGSPNQGGSQGPAGAVHQLRVPAVHLPCPRVVPVHFLGPRGQRQAGHPAVAELPSPLRDHPLGGHAAVCDPLG